MQIQENTPIPKTYDTPEIDINEQPFVTVTPKIIRPEHKAIFWWTSPIETADDVRPKYEIHPNELYFMINKEEKLIYYLPKHRNQYGAPWPTIFTRPNTTHFEEKNSRPDF